MDTQALKRMQAFAHIASQADFIDGILPDGQVVTKLGLICTVNFRNGGQRNTGYKVLGCFDRFVEQFGEHLKGHLHDFSKSRFSALRKDSVAKAREKLASLIDEGIGIEWHLQSEKTGEIAADYCIETLTSNAASDPYGAMSCLKLRLPWLLLEEETGEQQFRDWVVYLSDTLDIEHGYAGLACNLPFDRHLYQPYEYQIAQRFSGLMVDSFALIDVDNLSDHIKGVNWLTLLGPRYIEQLGGMAALKHTLQLPDVSVQETANGRLIIQAGVLPDVGAPETGHPPAYVAVNRVLRPVRVPNPDQLHTCMDDAEGFTKTNTLAWYARFDDSDTEDIPAGSLAQVRRCEANQPCPQDGIWWTPAKPDARRHFTRGEVMPDFPASTYGATIWYREAE